MSLVTLGFMDGSGGFSLVGATDGPTNMLTVTFSPGYVPVLSGPAAAPSSWTLTGGGSVLAVSVVGAAVVLTTTALTTGNVYTLGLPTTGITAVGGQAFVGAFNVTFTAASPVPVINIARAVDARTLDVVFSGPPNPANALLASSYSITGGAGLTVSSVAALSAVWYRLTTSKQVDDQVYTVTYTASS